MTMHDESESGFSLTELIVAVAIVGILGTVALPQYFNQLQKTRQNEAATTLSQIQTTIAAFVDEMGILPVSWSDLNKITPLMTPDGPANQENFGWITLASASCSKAKSEHCYEVRVIETDKLFVSTARPRNEDARSYNVVACLDLTNGASDLKKGTDSTPVHKKNLSCQRSEG